MAAAIKMDELLVSWLGNDTVYENVLNLIESYRAVEAAKHKDDQGSSSAGASSGDLKSGAPPNSPARKADKDAAPSDVSSQSSPRGVIPPFYPAVSTNGGGVGRWRRRSIPEQHETWEPLSTTLSLEGAAAGDATDAEAEAAGESSNGNVKVSCVRDQVYAIYEELGQDPPITSPGSAASGEETAKDLSRKYLTVENLVRITKEVCRFPSFFNSPLYQRILLLWNEHNKSVADMDVLTLEIFQWYWLTEMEPYDASERFFRLLKQPDQDFIGRDDFLPYIKELLNDHPGLEFLSNHAEFQEKYAVTVITRIFYSVNRCHSGRITSRQIRRSDLLEAFQQVDEEEDINKVTRYFSYEHFYVLYCRFWELDHNRDYRITREDLLKYGDHSLSHMIVDRIFDAAPRPFESESPTEENGNKASTNREYLSYEDFIFFMLSEEDKANEVSVRYWFSCVDVDGDGKLNNMEMRSFYAVQLHRMQCMGHEIVPFEDMLCQMMDMIKPSNPDYLVAEDFLQPECAQVSGALFDALFNLNKYLMFEQRDPFVERQKREDEFDTDWDRFACIDYNRLAMEEEAREEEAMEIDWVTVDDDDEDNEDFNSGGMGGSSEAPF